MPSQKPLYLDGNAKTPIAPESTAIEFWLVQA
mgnify:FL=1